jgi:1-acylglycerone phosphate reductase
MSSSKRTVLITGCSDGGLGAALAIAFHKAGLHVYATARNPSKMKQLQSLGIKTLTLDVLSDSSIASCVGQISSLEILVNNAGGAYNMPVSDISIPDAKKLFDLNVWSYLAMAQAFLPLLLKSKGMIVNQTSIASVAAIPFQSAYDASKAAMAMFSNLQRLELQAFGITVVELKTGVVRSNLIRNQKEIMKASLPKGSIYEPAKEVVEKALRQDGFADTGMAAEQWSKLVVQDLLRKSPPLVIWRGDQAWLARIAAVLPFGMFDGTVKKLTELDVVEQIVCRQENQG